MVVLGGDDFSEDYGVLGLSGLFKIGCPQENGQEGGHVRPDDRPFHSWRVPAVRWLLGKVNEIMARDPITQRYLINELKLDNAVLVGDLAFLPFSRNLKNLICHWQMITFAIVPSGLIWAYAKEPIRHEYIEVMVDICSYLLNTYLGANC